MGSISARLQILIMSTFRYSNSIRARRFWRRVTLGFHWDISLSRSTNAALPSENACYISISTRKTNTFVLLVLIRMSHVSLTRTGATNAHSQAQGNQPFRPPSCLTYASRGAGIEKSAKKWFSAHASVVCLCN